MTCSTMDARRGSPVGRELPNTSGRTAARGCRPRSPTARRCGRTSTARRSCTPCPAAGAGGGCVVVAVEEQVEAAADDHRLARARVSRSASVSRIVLHMKRSRSQRAVGDDALGSAVARTAAQKVGQLAAKRLVVARRAADLEERVPGLVPAAVSGGRGERLVEPALAAMSTCRPAAACSVGPRGVVLRACGSPSWHRGHECGRSMKHDLRPDRRRRLHRHVLGRVRQQRIPDGEPRRDVRRRARDAGEPEHVVVVAERRVDRDRRLGLRVDDVRDRARSPRAAPR